jgi:hypothetical protein
MLQVEFGETKVQRVEGVYHYALWD